MVNLKEASDRSDRQYWEMQDELRAEGFTNLCRQERLTEKGFWLKRKKEREMEVTSNVEESSMKDKQELKSITEQLQGLERRLKVVVATSLKEELHQCEADQVSTVVWY